MKQKQTEALEFRSPYGCTENVRVLVGSYSDNGSLYVGLIDEDGGPFTDVTVNLSESAALPPYHAAVKSYGENAGMAEFLVENRIGVPTGKIVSLSFNTACEFRFDKERLEQLSVNGLEEYIK